MAVNANADDYANARIGIFFPGQPATLTGQCVSLVKWFLGEMCGVSDWQSARGNAKDFGDTLVNQGLATIVQSPQRGDIVVFKQDGEGWGHIGIALSGGRIFEENVAVNGTASEIVDGVRVYASRIDPIYTSWRIGAPTFYRVGSYIENVQGGTTNVAIIQDADNWRFRANKSFRRIRGRDMSPAEFTPWIGTDFLHLIEALEDNAEADTWYGDGQLGKQATTENWQGEIKDLQAQVASLTAVANDDAGQKTQVTKLQSQLDAANTSIKTLTDQNSGLEAQLATSKTSLNAAETSLKSTIAQRNALQAHITNDQQVTQTWLQRLAAWISQYLPGKK